MGVFEPDDPIFQEPENATHYECEREIESLRIFLHEEEKKSIERGKEIEYLRQLQNDQESSMQHEITKLADERDD